MCHYLHINTIVCVCTTLWIFTLDMYFGYLLRIFTLDIYSGYLLWICTLDMYSRYVLWICTQDMCSGYVVLVYSLDTCISSSVCARLFQQVVLYNGVVFFLSGVVLYR